MANTDGPHRNVLKHLAHVSSFQSCSRGLNIYDQSIEELAIHIRKSKLSNELELNGNIRLSNELERWGIYGMT